MEDESFKDFSGFAPSMFPWLAPGKALLPKAWRAFPGVSNPWPTAHGPEAAHDGYECGPTQNHKFT